MSIEKVLVVDDELLMRNFLVETLQRKGIEIVCASNGRDALKLIQQQPFDLVISDVKMPELSGTLLLKEVKALHPHLLVILITAYASIESAVEAMRLGAFHYLIKPFLPETIETLLERAREQQLLVEENHFLRQELVQQQHKKLHELITKSPAMEQILQDLSKIAKSNSSVLICGETGTGKEVIAHAIHFQSQRAAGPFIKVNCAAIPDTLIESEFFGHEKGAFTGAAQKKIGRFERADKGTLLLDEISEVPPSLQSKLLRAIQEREFERVGGVRPVQVDVRLISTSNRNMKEAIENKAFREDLYYRLNVVPIHLPPLRQRRDDIIPLATYFLEKFCLENHKSRKELSQEARKKLLDYSWPGNIRELANVIERAVVMDSGGTIGSQDLPLETYPTRVDTSPQSITLQELEKRHILEALERCAHNRTQAALQLGISIRTLRNKLNSYQANL